MVTYLVDFVDPAMNGWTTHSWGGAPGATGFDGEQDDASGCRGC
ncbi:hypothetical protein [Lacunimicrobium album]